MLLGTVNKNTMSVIFYCPICGGKIGLHVERKCLLFSVVIEEYHCEHFKVECDSGVYSIVSTVDFCVKEIERQSK
jgi:hypothetical protein